MPPKKVKIGRQQPSNKISDQQAPSQSILDEQPHSQSISDQQSFSLPISDQRLQNFIYIKLLIHYTTQFKDLLI